MSIARLFFIGIIIAAFTGCAFNPQTVEFNPQVSVEPSDIGVGTTLGLRVIDDRVETELGRRGTTAGAAAGITTEQDLVQVIEDVAVESLTRKGFAVQPAGEAQPNLEIRLRLLEYSTSTGFWTGGVHLKGTITVHALTGDNSLEKTYRHEHEERVGVVPTADTNEVWMNELLDELLSQVFSDAELLDHLAGPGT